MFNNKKYRVTGSTTDPKGKKTTITVTTDDEKVVRSLLDSSHKDFMNAEFKETKSSSSTSKNNSKTTSKFNKKATAKALPTPKATNSLTKQVQKKEVKLKDVNNKNKRIYTTSELRKKLRNLKPYREELVLGKDVIVKTTTGYGIRNINDHDDPMTDYSAYTYGFKEKWILERAKRNGLIKD